MAKDLEKEVEKLLDKEEKEETKDKKDLSKDERELIKEYIKQLKKDAADSQEEVKHQVAENRNMLKRRDDQEKDLRKFAASKLGEAIVPDIDLLKKVVASAENTESPEVKNYLAGFQMVLAKMEDSLSQAGITQIVVKPGSEYDSSCEQSVEQVDSDKYKSGQVTEVISNGYRIHDRVLIHAKVKVAK